MPRVLRLLIAFGEVLLSHSAILCYFAMVLNTLMSGSIISLLFPISIFFWAMLSVPLPKKSYWVTVITYTEVRLDASMVCGNFALWFYYIFMICLTFLWSLSSLTERYISLFCSVLLTTFCGFRNISMVYILIICGQGLWSK